MGGLGWISLCIPVPGLWHADRDRTRKAAKYVTIDRTRYNDEDTERIDSLYEGEVVRGSTPRFARDVVVGEELGPIVKGPLSVTDIICWHSGTGFGEFGVGALKLGYKNRKGSRVLPADRVRQLGCGDASTLGSGLGRAPGSAGALRLRGHAQQLDGSSRDELDGR